VRTFLAAAAMVALAVLYLWPGPRRRILQLPAGVTEVHSPTFVEAGTEVFGGNLRAASDFAGPAILVVRGNNVRLHDFSIDGNRDALEVRSPLPPSDVPFEKFTRANGILAAGVSGLAVENVRFQNIAGFAILVSRSRGVAIDRVSVQDSGSRNPAGRNNTTGGILFEEGTANFRVTRSELRDIRGNGVWTHSLYTSPRNVRGLFSLNSFDTVGRDAIQVGHAMDVQVERNQGARIGFPAEDVDIENLAVPVGIDTAGNVERSSYSDNRFTDVNGKCIDLDGFHDGEVTGNVCIGLGNYGIVMNDSNPDMRSQNIRITGNTIVRALFGGIFVIGAGHWIAHNHLLDLNQAHCNENAAKFGCYYASGEPDMLRSGIYLGRGAARPDPARGNVLEDNEITGFHMDARCIAAAPGILPAWNTIRRNICRPGI